MKTSSCSTKLCHDTKVVAADVGSTDDPQALAFWQSSDVLGFSDYQRLFMFLEHADTAEQEAGTYGNWEYDNVIRQTSHLESVARLWNRLRNLQPGLGECKAVAGRRINKRDSVEFGQTKS